MAKPAVFICEITIIFAIMKNCLAVEDKLRGKSCPVWSYAETDRCECYRDIREHLRCNDEGYIVGLKGCSCSTFNWRNNVTTIGYCLYGCKYFNGYSFEAPANISDIDSIMCGLYKRNGTLCGTCHKETYPAVYSFSMTCIYCKHVILSWITFVVWSFIPVTIFYIVIMLLSANLMSSKLSGYIIFCQSITSPFIIRIMLLKNTHISQFRVVYKIFGAIYGIWNLDFLRTFSNGICLGTNSLVTLFLDIVIAIYPLCLIIFTHKCISMYGENKIVTAMLKPIVKYITKFKSREIHTSIIDSIATFVYLINIKILNSCFDLLMPVNIYKLTDREIKNTSTRLFYDADIVYFGAAHKPYGITALIVVIFFVFLPTLLLLVYPFKVLQKLLNLLLSPRWQLFVRTFVESFNRCYKDGTKDNEKDCRYFAAFPFIIRITVFLLYLMSPNGEVLLFAAIVLTTYSLFLAISEPFKDQYKHLLDSYTLFNFVLSSCCVSYSVYAYYPQQHYVRYIFAALDIISLTIPGVYILIHFLYIVTNALLKLLAKRVQT